MRLWDFESRNNPNNPNVQNPPKNFITEAIVMPFCTILAVLVVSYK